MQSENAKLTQRAERFGGKDGASSEEPSADKEKMLEKRAQRFGITPSSSPAAAANGNGSPALSAEALEKRAKRFGTAAATSPAIEVGILLSVLTYILYRIT